MKLAFFDFETTGKDLKNDRVTQIAVALYDSDSRYLLSSFSNTVYSEEYPNTNDGALTVTGISDEFLIRCGELPRESFIILMHYFSKADYIVGHNIKKFDIPILMEEMVRMHLPITEIKNVIDTRTDIEYPEHIATRKLSYLALEHGIQVIGAHAALFDVITNAQLFFKYDLDRTIILSQSPELWIRADVSFDNKDKAKELKYFWDGKNKIWVKQIKELHYEDEKKRADFGVLKLSESYSFPEEK